MLLTTFSMTDHIKRRRRVTNICGPNPVDVEKHPSMQLLRSLTTNSSDTDPTILDEMDEGSDQLFFVTSYSDFDKLGEFLGLPHKGDPYGKSSAVGCSAKFNFVMPRPLSYFPRPPLILKQLMVPGEQKPHNASTFTVFTRPMVAWYFLTSLEVKM
jgi:hypothetical protein